MTHQAVPVHETRYSVELSDIVNRKGSSMKVHNEERRSSGVSLSRYSENVTETGRAKKVFQHFVDKTILTRSVNTYVW